MAPPTSSRLNPYCIIWMLFGQDSHLVQKLTPDCSSIPSYTVASHEPNRGFMTHQIELIETWGKLSGVVDEEKRDLKVGTPHV